jgi:hypothetical protein
MRHSDHTLLMATGYPAGKQLARWFLLTFLITTEKNGIKGTANEM